MTMAATATEPLEQPGSLFNETAFALGIICILLVLFIPLPSVLLDLGLAFSITVAILILMVSLWITRPTEFSSFPMILLLATMLRLALNVATTRIILSHGHEGPHAAGHVIAGFASFVMGGDFLIGLIVFAILLTVNFIVITKGASRIAEVAARFTLDAMPGKQMAIDADLSAGLIDEREATRRRREVEDEAAFFGAMDGASKFVRGDAIAGLIITVINACGGAMIGVLRHGMSLEKSIDYYLKLSVGDGLVTQIPALVISLAAGLLVSKGGVRGSADKAVLDQLGGYPRAMLISAGVVGALGLAPGLPFLPFAVLAGGLATLGFAIPRREAAERQRRDDGAKEVARVQEEKSKQSVKELLRTADIELQFGKQLSRLFVDPGSELGSRAARLRRKFARQYGFVVPEIRVSDELAISPKSYQIRIHGSVVAAGELRPGDVLVVVGDGEKPNFPGDETREPAFGMRAFWVPELYSSDLKREGFTPVDNVSVLLTHLAEVIGTNLAQLLSYKDMRSLIDRLDPEYKKLADEICPAHITYSGLQAVLKMLLAERVSIRNLHIILEAIAEVAPFIRRVEAIGEHVRQRIAQQICGDLSEGGRLKVVKLGNRWELAFHQALRRDAKGEIVEFDLDPRRIEQFSTEVGKLVSKLQGEGHQFAIVSTAEARPYLRMLIERLFPSLVVLSHAEISRSVNVTAIGSLS